MVELPSIKSKRWHFRSWVLDICAAIVACFLGIVVGYKYLRDPSATLTEKIGPPVAAALILILNGIKAWKTRKFEARYETIDEPDILVSAVGGLHEELCKIKNCSHDALGVRAVVYKLHWDKHRLEPLWLEQAMNYIGGVGGSPGRRLSARVGIIGRAARLGEGCLGSRQSADIAAYRSELVGAWGFTAREANEINADCWSWMALPLLEDDERTPYGVLFLDARDKHFLTIVRYGTRLQDIARCLLEPRSGNTLLRANQEFGWQKSLLIAQFLLLKRLRRKMQPFELKA